VRATAIGKIHGLVGQMWATHRYTSRCFLKIPRKINRSGLAQLVEQLTVNQRVAGSSPASGAI
jgi:hypothetical protein